MDHLIVAVAFILFLIVTVWLYLDLRILDKAGNERLAMLDEIKKAIPYRYDIGFLLDDVKAVTLIDHMRELRRGRDPLKLYSRRIQELMNPPTEVPFQ